MSNVFGKAYLLVCSAMAYHATTYDFIDYILIYSNIRYIYGVAPLVNINNYKLIRIL